MQQEIIIAGFGGQGVLFAGQVIAYAALAEGRHVTWIPSYGPEMRGGTANCTVVVSDEEIGSPLVKRPSAAIVLNQPSMDRYAPLVAPGGVLVVDASLIETRSGRTDIHEFDVMAKDIAAELGQPRAANVVALGALVAATGVVQLASVEAVLAKKFAANPEVLHANRRALHLGAEFTTKVAG